MLLQNIGCSLPSKPTRVIKMSAFYALLILITGCSHLIEHKITSVKVDLPFKDPLELTPSNKKQYCASTVGCFDYLDFAHPKVVLEGATLPLSDFNFTLSEVRGDQVNEDEMRFTFQSLPDNAPLLLIFPGYGMTFETSVPAAAFFRHLGFHVVIFTSPTEQQAFDFGESVSAQALALVEKLGKERALYAYSMSMGALGLAHFQQRLETAGLSLSGAILNSPLTDFSGSTSELFEQFRGESWWFKAIPRSSFQSALSRIEQKGSTYNLKWPELAPLLPESSLVLSSQHDNIADQHIVSALANANSYTVTEFQDYPHGVMALVPGPLRERMVEWLETELGALNHED